MLCTALRLPVLNMRHSAHVVLAQRKQNGSAPVPVQSDEYHYEFGELLLTFISSPEPKAQVSYCRPFSCVVRKLFTFHLLENAWLDFNQTWQESSLGVGDSKLFK